MASSLVLVKRAADEVADAPEGKIRVFVDEGGHLVVMDENGEVSSPTVDLTPVEDEIAAEEAARKAADEAEKSDRETADSAKVAKSEKGAAGGVAELDGGGKIPAAQLAITAVEYKGTWNASTNSPTLANGTGNTGDLYRVSVAASHNFGAGAIDFEIGDYVVYSGSVWEKIGSTSVDVEAVEAIIAEKADPAGEAADAVETHVGATDPHGDRKYADDIDTVRSQLTEDSTLGYATWNTTWPARPTGYAAVQWVGPEEAGKPSGAVTGDIIDLFDPS